MSDAPAPEEKLSYRLISGPDDRAFCERISAALAEGYVLHGSPAATFNGSSVIVAQAVADAVDDLESAGDDLEFDGEGHA